MTTPVEHDDLLTAAEAALAQRQLVPARDLLDRARRTGRNAARTELDFAHLCALQGDIEAAICHAEAAREAGADTVATHVMIGRFHQIGGDLPRAAQAFAAALAISPDDGPALLALAQIDPAALLSRLADLRRLTKAPAAPPDQAAPCAYALGRVLDHAQDFNAAFNAFTRANALRRRQFPGPVECPRDAAMRAACGADVLARRPGNPSDQPVFIVGLMRSGTTLLEQMLSSHPDVAGHGERADILHIARALDGQRGLPRYPASLAAVDAPTFRRLADACLAGMRAEAPGAARHIDKLPHNFEHLGLIALLFPNARILHCVRDPLDTCLSNYFQDYAAKNLFTCDMQTLGAYYAAYQSLMRHWDAVLGRRIHAVRYEALVADTEAVLRGVLAFLDLPWNSACLKFTDNPRAVYTKSNAQVRRPVFTDGIGRAAHYTPHLGTLRAALARN